MNRLYILVLTILSLSFHATRSNAQELKSFRPGMIYSPDYTRGDTLTILAYNTENFTDRKDNPYISNRMEDGAVKDTD